MSKKLLLFIFILVLPCSVLAWEERYGGDMIDSRNEANSTSSVDSVINIEGDNIQNHLTPSQEVEVRTGGVSTDLSLDVGDIKPTQNQSFSISGSRIPVRGLNPAFPGVGTAQIFGPLDKTIIEAGASLIDVYTMYCPTEVYSNTNSDISQRKLSGWRDNIDVYFTPHQHYVTQANSEPFKEKIQRVRMVRALQPGKYMCGGIMTAKAKTSAVGHTDFAALQNEIIRKVQSLRGFHTILVFTMPQARVATTGVESKGRSLGLSLGSSGVPGKETVTGATIGYTNNKSTTFPEATAGMTVALFALLEEDSVDTRGIEAGYQIKEKTTSRQQKQHQVLQMPIDVGQKAVGSDSLAD